MSCAIFGFNGCNSVPVSFDFSSMITYTDSADVAIDLTGYTISMIIQAKNTDTDLLTLGIVGDTSTTGIYMPNPTLGEFFIQIRKADTVTLGVGSYDYKIRFTDPSANETLFLYGDITFIKVG